MMDISHIVLIVMLIWLTIGFAIMMIQRDNAVQELELQKIRCMCRELKVNERTLIVTPIEESH